jgi:hypothetical protein
MEKRLTAADAALQNEWIRCRIDTGQENDFGARYEKKEK